MVCVAHEHIDPTTAIQGLSLYPRIQSPQSCRRYHEIHPPLKVWPISSSPVRNLRFREPILSNSATQRKTAPTSPKENTNPSSVGRTCRPLAQSCISSALCTAVHSNPGTALGMRTKKTCRTPELSAAAASLVRAVLKLPILWTVDGGDGIRGHTGRHGGSEDRARSKGAFQCSSRPQIQERGDSRVWGSRKCPGFGSILESPV